MFNLLSLLIGRASAQGSGITLHLPTSLYDPNNPGKYNIQQTLTSLIFGFLAAAAFVGIIYSGIMMITAGGDAAKMEAGKKNLLWSVIGVVIVILSYFIIKFVYSLTGAIIKPTP